MVVAPTADAAVPASVPPEVTPADEDPDSGESSLFIAKLVNEFDGGQTFKIIFLMSSQIEWFGRY